MSMPSHSKRVSPLVLRGFASFSLSPPETDRSRESLEPFPLFRLDAYPVDPEDMYHSDAEFYPLPVAPFRIPESPEPDSPTPNQKTANYSVSLLFLYSCPCLDAYTRQASQQSSDNDNGGVSVLNPSARDFTPNVCQPHGNRHNIPVLQDPKVLLHSHQAYRDSKTVPAQAGSKEQSNGSSVALQRTFSPSPGGYTSKTTTTASFGANGTTEGLQNQSWASTGRFNIKRVSINHEVWNNETQDAPPAMVSPQTKTFREVKPTASAEKTAGISGQRNIRRDRYVENRSSREILGEVAVSAWRRSRRKDERSDRLDDPLSLYDALTEVKPGENQVLSYTLHTNAIMNDVDGQARPDGQHAFDVEPTDVVTIQRSQPLAFNRLHLQHLNGHAPEPTGAHTSEAHSQIIQQSRESSLLEGSNKSRALSGAKNTHPLQHQLFHYVAGRNGQLELQPYNPPSELPTSPIVQRSRESSGSPKSVPWPFEHGIPAAYLDQNTEHQHQMNHSVVQQWQQLQQQDRALQQHTALHSTFTNQSFDSASPYFQPHTIPCQIHQRLGFMPATTSGFPEPSGTAATIHIASQPIFPPDQADSIGHDLYGRPVGFPGHVHQVEPIARNAEWGIRIAKHGQETPPALLLLPYRPGSEAMCPMPTVSGASVRLQNLTRHGQPTYDQAASAQNLPFANRAQQGQPHKWGVVKIGNVS